MNKQKRKPSRFNLDTEETQWSKKAGQNAFHPIYPNNNEETYTLDPMQESDIVTAGSNTDNKVNSMEAKIIFHCHKPHLSI